MADVNLPKIKEGENIEQKVMFLTDAYYKLRKELEFLLQNLDDNNILEVDAAKIKNLLSENIITNTFVTQSLYAERGYIAELTVDRLDTSSKVRNYLVSFTSPASDITFGTNTITSASSKFGSMVIGDTLTISGCTVNAENNKIAVVTNATASVLTFAAGTFTAGAETAAITFKVTSDVNYIKIYDQYFQWITASTNGSATTQATDRKANPLYWTDGTYKSTTLTVTAFPVTIFVYTELIKLQILFEDADGTGVYIPIIKLGAGTGVGNNGKAFMYKSVTGFYIDYYHSTTGAKITFSITDAGISGGGGGTSVGGTVYGYKNLGGAL